MNLGQNPSATATAEFRRASLPLLAAAFGLACGLSGLPLYTLGFFIAPLSEAFGWSRTALGAWATFYTLALLVAAPLAGRLVDRFGARPIASACFVLLAGTWAAAALNRGSLTYFYATAVGIAILGCGTLPGTFSKVVASWFSKSRGLALGISMCGTLVGVTIAGQVLPRLIQSAGWQTGYYTLALFALSALPFTLLWLVEQPRSFDRGAKVEHGLTRNQAVRHPVFWLLGASFMFFCLTATGVVVHLVPRLTERGVTATELGLYVSVMSIAGGIGRVAMGWLLDRIFAPRLMVPIFMLTGVACLLLIWGSDPWVWFAVAVIGLAIGIEIDLIAYLTAAYFGLRDYTTLYGYLYSIYAVGAALGPLGVGWLFDLSGSYTLPYCIAAGSAVISALLFIPISRFGYLESRRAPEGAHGRAVPTL